MLPVTRNTFVLVVIGFTLFGYTNVDADSDYYRVTINGRHSAYGPSTYDIKIEEPFPFLNSSTRDSRYHSMCHLDPTISCSGGTHIANIPGIMNQVLRERKQQRALKAETELLEVQTELLRYQLQQQQRAERNARQQQRQHQVVANPNHNLLSPTPKQQQARARLLARVQEQARTHPQRQPSGIDYERCSKAKQHSQSILSKLASKLGLKKSHQCTADCVD
jgi:hypothetical protein